MSDPASETLEGLRILWTREEVAAGVEAVADRMVAAFRDVEVVNLAPVLTGGLHMAAALSIALERRVAGKWLLAPVFASAYAGDGELAAPVIEFSARFEQRLDPHGPVVVVDDLLDSGTTMSELVRRLEGLGLGPVQIAVLVERDRQRAVDIRPDFCAFHVAEDEWLVGFGMDSERRLRGLDAVYIRDA